MADPSDPSQFWSCAAATLLLAVASGCGPGSGDQAPVRALSAAEAGAAASLPVEELLTITLDARLSTGFAWQVDEIDASMLRLASREHVPAAAMGGMDQEILRFAGVGRGRTSLGIFYRRSWETPGTGPVYRVEVDVAGPYAGPELRPASAAAAQLVAPPAAVSGGTIPASYDFCASDPEHPWLDPDHPYARCTPVKDQGGCGACWAFATVGVLENILHVANPEQVPDLSEQYLVSCNVQQNPSWGCNGGYVAFDYFIDREAPPETDAGAVYEADFPYAGVDSDCGSSPHPHHEWLADWGWTSSALTTTPAEAVIQQAILDHGPVWTDVCVDRAFQDWKPSDGVFTGSGCTKKNHGVVLVGWGVDDKDGPYWIMRNSWGPSWGDSGYMRIKWGANAIASKAAYAVYDPRAPHASAGPAQTVDQGALVTLDGSASRDSDGPVRSYAWEQVQTTGPTVELFAADTAWPTFTAPAVSATTTLRFRLTVQDDAGIQSTSDLTTVTVSSAPERVKTSGGGGGCGTGGGAAGWALAGLLLALAVRLRPRTRA